MYSHFLLCQVEEPYDPERCFDYPLQLDLDLDRDLGDDESFDVDDGKMMNHPGTIQFNLIKLCLFHKEQLCWPKVHEFETAVNMWHVYSKC